MCINMLLVYYLHLLKVCMVNSPSVVHGISSRKSSYFAVYDAILLHQLQCNAPKRPAPVDCQIEFLSFERLEMSSRARIRLYPLQDQTTRK